MKFIIQYRVHKFFNKDFDYEILTDTLCCEDLSNTIFFIFRYIGINMKFCPFCGNKLEVIRIN